MKQNKKKAFTLAELLVVVIVLGVLVAVAVPKFKRTLETRRTTEAENMLAAIRTEQEKRCIMGYDYQTDATKLGALAKAGSSKHYDYSLQSTGATATTEGYNLQIPSYKDGRICCSGEGCEALNKNYPSCESLTLPADECAAPVSTPTEPEPEEPEDPNTYTVTDENGCEDTYSYESETCFSVGSCSKSGVKLISTTCQCREQRVQNYTNNFGSIGSYDNSGPINDTSGHCWGWVYQKQCVETLEDGTFRLGSWETVREDTESGTSCACHDTKREYVEGEGCLCTNRNTPPAVGGSCCVSGIEGTIAEGDMELQSSRCTWLFQCSIHQWLITGRVDDCPADAMSVDEYRESPYNLGACDPATDTGVKYAHANNVSWCSVISCENRTLGSIYQSCQ